MLPRYSVITRRRRRQTESAARRIIVRHGLDLSEAEWLMIAPNKMVDKLFAHQHLISRSDILYALVVNMLARARGLGFLPRSGCSWLTEALTEAERDGYEHIVDMHT